jgi:hypothetical protein
MEDTQKDTARDQARMQLDSIVELMDGLKQAQEVGHAVIDGDTLDEESIRERINEDPLSVEVRTDWHVPGNDEKPTEYNILLCTGGPACRIIGELSEHGWPETAKIEYQDWGTPWTRYGDMTDEEDEQLLAYAQQFYFGE